MKTAWLALSAACLTISGNNAATARAATQSAEPAAMPAGIDCVRNRFSPDEWRAFSQLVVELGSNDDPRVQPLVRGVEACGTQLSWSPRKRQLAGMLVVGVAGTAALRAELAGQGIRIEQLDPTILSDRELVAAAENGAVDSAAGQAFAMRHMAEIERIAAGRSLTEGFGMKLGNYVGFRLLIDVAARLFGNAR